MLALTMSGCRDNGQSNPFAQDAAPKEVSKKPVLAKAGGAVENLHPYAKNLKEAQKKYALPTSGKHPLTSNLYNGETITLPDWLYDELAGLNAQLREKLTPSDYLEVLKGVQSLLGHVATKDALSAHLKQTMDSNSPLYWYSENGANLNHLENLRAKLQQILKEADDDKIFARPRFLPPATKGIIYDGHLRYTPQEVVFSNERYVVSTSAGLSKGMSSVYHFWDARTCRVESSCAIPTWVIKVPRYEAKGGEHFFSLQEMMGEAAGYMWDAVMYNSYILSPERMELQSNRTKGTMWDETKKWTSEGQLASRSPWKGSAVIDIEAMQRSEPKATDANVTDPLRMFTPTSEQGGSNQLMQPIHHPHELALGYHGREKHMVVDFNSLTLRRDSHDAASAAEKNKSAVAQKVQPAPAGVDGTSDLTDVSAENQGYTLFQYNGGTYDESSPSPSLMGLVTPYGDVKLFANLGLAGNQSAFMPPNGNMISYMNAVQLGGSSEEFNIKSSGIYEWAPKVSNWHVYPSAENNKVLVFMSLNLKENKNGTWIVEVDLNQDTFRVVHHWEHRSYMLPAVWLPEKSLLLKPESDDCYAIIKIAEGKPDKKVASMYVMGDQGFAIVLPNGCYAGSPGCEAFLRVGDGEQSISLQALAPWRKRPGEVLKALDGKAGDVAALNQATKNWLEKQGFNIHSMPAEPKPNALPVAEVEMPDLMVSRDSVRFKVKLRATARDIVRLDVRVDGLLIPQPDAKLIETADTEREVKVTVPLACGQNWIEVTPVDDAGISGDTRKFRVICKRKAKSDMYVVAVGVSKYDKNGLDVHFASKGAEDLAAALEKHAKCQVRTLVLTDKKVADAKVLDEIQDFLKQATEDDRVIFYLGGQGKCDDKGIYHYAPATFDPNRVQETGISIKALTQCLQECKAHKRLMLVDTAHSGQMAGADPGVHIISGADDSGRGVMTDTILKCLNGEIKADFLADGTLTVEELQQAVQEAVYEASSGQQNICVQSAEEAYNFPLMPAAAALPMPVRQPVVQQPVVYQPVVEPVAPPPVDAQALVTEGLDWQYGKNGKTRDYARAVECYRQAAELGNSDAQNNLGHMYHQGWGIGKDLNQAAHWYRLSADQGNAYGQSNYGTCVEFGWGVTPNKAEAIDWYRKAAAQGHQSAKKHLRRLNVPETAPAATPTSFSAPSGGGGDRSSLDPLIERMAALRCRHATSKLYQQRLLTLLPLIRHGEDVDITLPETKGNTALHYSCAIGSLSITKWLLEHGANPNAVTDKGATPLQCVGSDNGPQIRNLLKQYGAGNTVPAVQQTAPPTRFSGGDRSSLDPLIARMAALRCRHATSKLYQQRLLTLLPLIRQGYDVNTTLPETKGNTALHYSCAIGSLSITKWLLEHGANPNAVTDAGATPLQCVGADNGPQIRNLLKQYGAVR